ncbi:MAG: nucleotidyltransferase domain-containing protein [Limnobacter sp.]|uniref:nucleotidyltransferase domain-containing protein n=1 Tax=Limnobacter sp. TaxID=2003368 RepID=UPI0032ED1136
MSSEIVRQLTSVFARYPNIETVYLFGSRAKGNFRDGSDIDLAVLAPEMKPEIFTQLWNEIDALPMVFKVDCLHFEQLENDALKQKVLNEGVVFYQASSAGRST